MDLATLFQQQIAIVEDELLIKAAPALGAFFTNVAGNPTVLNISAQAVSLEAQLVAVIPGVAQAEMANLAAAVSAYVQAAATKAAAEVAAAEKPAA